MALIVKLKFVENLHGKFDRQVKLTFRGKTHESTVVHSAKRVAYFGQSFEWPIARAITAEESVVIQLYNYNKYLTSKLIGSYVLILQQLIQKGELKIDECLVDTNNKVLEVTVNFEIEYNSPDGRVGSWGDHAADFIYPITEDYNPNLDLANLKDMEDEGDDTNYWVDTGAEHAGEDTASQTLLMDAMYQAKRLRPDMVEWELHQERDFQIKVTVIEGQQLAGLDIDPVVKVDWTGSLATQAYVSQTMTRFTMTTLSLSSETLRLDC